MRPILLAACLAACGSLVACATPTEATYEVELTAAERRDRAALIRDAAAELGVYNAALIGGIAVSETQLAHCQAEATYACPGPASPSCGGGPIIAGSADGPCADMQGGLGMFQLDAGTYAQTVGTYGEAILTVEGNTAQAVSFVIERLQQDLAGVDDWMAAAAYLNAVPLVAGDPTTEQWAAFLACRYNGCCAQSTLCTSRAAGYRDNAIALAAELGAAFWDTASRCAGLPEGGIIDQRSACYVAAGEPRYWRRDATGYGGSSEWTSTTMAAAPANYARWLIRPGRAGRLQLDVHVQGGEATTAVYEISHGGTVARVTVDQTAVDGFVSLGDFEFTGDGTEYVQLGDNTGVGGQRLVVDALRVVSLDGSDGDVSTIGGCGCDGGGGSAGFGIAVLALVRRRRRRG